MDDYWRYRGHIKRSLLGQFRVLRPPRRLSPINSRTQRTQRVRPRSKPLQRQLSRERDRQKAGPAARDTWSAHERARIARGKEGTRAGSLALERQGHKHTTPPTLRRRWGTKVQARCECESPVVRCRPGRTAARPPPGGERLARLERRLCAPVHRLQPARASPSRRGKGSTACVHRRRCGSPRRGRGASLRQGGRHRCRASPPDGPPAQAWAGARRRSAEARRGWEK